MIAVVGEIQTDNYTDKDGNKRKKTEISVNNASFCGGKQETRQNNEMTTQANFVAPAPAIPQDIEFTEVDDDELPF